MYACPHRPAEHALGSASFAHGRAPRCRHACGRSPTPRSLASCAVATIALAGCTAAPLGDLTIDPSAPQRVAAGATLDLDATPVLDAAADRRYGAAVYVIDDASTVDGATAPSRTRGGAVNPVSRPSAAVPVACPMAGHLDPTR